MDITIDLVSKWIDNRLSWNPADWNRIPLIQVDPDLVWTPGLVLLVT